MNLNEIERNALLSVDRCYNHTFCFLQWSQKTEKKIFVLQIHLFYFIYFFTVFDNMRNQL